MVEQLQTFATEVSRVALEVGSEGMLGGCAIVKDVDGTWKDLTNNGTHHNLMLIDRSIDLFIYYLKALYLIRFIFAVNMMAGNLTTQVRSIAAVTTAVARGDLSRKITYGSHSSICTFKPFYCQRQPYDRHVGLTSKARFFSSRKLSTPWSISSARSPPRLFVSLEKSERRVCWVDMLLLTT